MALEYWRLSQCQHHGSSTPLSYRCMQVKRMCSPALIVANHDAQHFPVIHSAKEVRHDAVEWGAC